MKTGLKPTLTRVLAGAGFAYKNKVWVRPVGETLQGFTIDHSQYSERIYLECGVFLAPMLGSEKPIIHRAPLTKRIEPEKGTPLFQLCENPNVVSDDEAFDVLTMELRPKMEEFFSKFDTIEKIESVIRICNTIKIASIDADIMRWFGVKIPT